MQKVHMEQCTHINVVILVIGDTITINVIVLVVGNAITLLYIHPREKQEKLVDPHRHSQDGQNSRKQAYINISVTAVGNTITVHIIILVVGNAITLTIFELASKNTACHECQVPVSSSLHQCHQECPCHWRFLGYSGCHHPNITPSK
jgi:hypothetical protein